MQDRPSYFWYDAAYIFSMIGATLGLSLRNEGRANVPAVGPALLIANHQSFLDPVLVAVSMRRHLCFLARKSLFRNRFFGALIRNLHAVPIDQDGVGKEGIRTAVDQLRQGQAVLVFPEGTRTDDGRLQPLKPGIHLLIKRAHSPVIPVGIAGAYDAWPASRPWPILAPLFLPAGKATVAVSVGKPLDGRYFAELPREQALAELFQELQKMTARAEHLRRRA